MTKITLELDIDRLSSYYEGDTGYYDIETIEGAIVTAAAHALLGKYDQKITLLINAEIQRIIVSGIEEQVRDRVDEMVADAFNSEYPVLNSFGKPTGETTSIIAQVEGMLETIINERVDYNGKKLTDSYGRRDSKTRWEWHVEKIITEMVDREFKRHLESVVKEAQRAAKERIAEKILELGN